MKLVPWLLLCAVGLPLAAAPETDPPITPLTRTVGAVGQLINSEIPGYYASAVYYDADEEHLFILTNDHAIPRSPELQKTLQFKGIVTGMKPVTATFLGRAPGYDVAALAIARQPTPGVRYTLADLRRGLRASFFSEVVQMPPGATTQAALIGVPRYWEEYDTVVIQNRSWADAMEYLSTHPNPQALSFEPAQLRSQVHIDTSSDCPPPFLERCYLVPMQSWGFSGGALAVSARDQERRPNVPIAGLISHFSPLGETTYAIPFSIARRVADRLRDQALRLGRPVVETRDEQGRYEIQPDGRIRLLTGPLAGRLVGRPDGRNKPAGLGESRGGGGIPQIGGESRGGGGLTQPGGESRGGGGATSASTGSCATCYEILPEESGITFLIARWARLKASAENSDNWGQPNDLLTEMFSVLYHFKGADALFAYQPGARLWSGDRSQVVHWLGDRRLVNVNSFLDSYSRTPTRETLSFFVPRTIPVLLRSIGGWANAGIHTRGVLRQWKKYEEVKRMAREGVRSPVGYDAEELSAIVDNFAPDNLKIDMSGYELMSHRERSSSFAVASQASAIFVDNQLNGLSFTDSRLGEINLGFRGGWRAIGNYLYQSRGEFWMRSEGRYRWGKGVALLEWEVDKRRWEFRLVLASITPSAERVEDPYFTDEEIRLDAVYLPLQ